MNLRETVNALAGVISADTDGTSKVRRLVIDSRKVRKGDIFAAFPGENVDGSLYAAEAVNRGASLVIMENRAAYDALQGNKVLVRDVLAAVKGLGAYKLRKYNGTKIAVTGSMGKTSTKELISSVLSSRRRVYTAYGNYNNELGVAICAANLNMRSTFAVFEFGTNSPGEIAELSKYVKPEIAVVTGIGHAHIGRMGSIEKLAEEKLSIVDGMKKDSVLWVNDTCRKYLDDKVLGSVEVRYYGEDMNCDVILADANRNNKGQFYFTAVHKGFPYCFILDHVYSHFITNSLVAIGIGFSAGLDYQDVMKGVLKFKPVKGRGAVKVINGIRVIDDTYNAGFESIISAVENLDEMPDEKRYALIGEMGEIEGFEEMLYLRLYKEAKKRKDINFIFAGQSYRKFQDTENISIAPTKEEARELVSGISEGVVLIKASRAKRFEEFIDFIEKEKKRSAV
ncbi:UDP-N-acetylmuramoyl-tripeptide--D-alanyl-D-alanine ligase [Limisalsivibrio acetivorans]|uniref:UDP-N-acetylmuramoyl-tripeptide--D-alanyl-D- alanine ligase n=1 Tax=Limisalsivibrio acetivorans TaxID=1304888 RepID=UPI0003B58C17|nr:UDP-N-acetylmuramoyl-tripeptide--D-alanyl-D-alanine ligase [Limisalsivibrio acetivorans]